MDARSGEASLEVVLVATLFGDEGTVVFSEAGGEVVSTSSSCTSSSLVSDVPCVCPNVECLFQSRKISSLRPGCWSSTPPMTPVCSHLSQTLGKMWMLSLTSSQSRCKQVVWSLNAINLSTMSAHWTTVLILICPQRWWTVCVSHILNRVDSGTLGFPRSKERQLGI